MSARFELKITSPVGLASADEAAGRALIDLAQVTPIRDGQAFVACTESRMLAIARCESSATNQCLVGADLLREPRSFNALAPRAFPPVDKLLEQELKRPSAATVTFNCRLLKKLAKALGSSDGQVTIIVSDDPTSPIKVVTRTGDIGLLMPVEPPIFVIEEYDPPAKRQASADECWRLQAQEYVDAHERSQASAAVTPQAQPAGSDIDRKSEGGQAHGD
ncbi:hypothetical protein Plim_4280 (plasmid) [Planctopirus limnophila DSM 3776]|uniref:Uncharacterized protein n=1 Tax=Planctopirus limnophila (strain ATCC 43296 / DSM 3776 / IFAM 1008 / Mu 290) TaxID=521674 RepID=D5SZG7_PLAL2|nr:hypothetical protein [Planctopirus limnophila]ADG70087.1 hypothetical protein Plim_4280 [Planctopirus limnophila DSM 3776]